MSDCYLTHNEHFAASEREQVTLN